MKIKRREEVDNKYKWDLEKIFKDTESFDQEYDLTKRNICNFKNYKDKVMLNENNLLQAIMDYNEINRKLDKLYTYASMKSDEDISNDVNQVLKNRVINLYDLMAQNTYFFELEIMASDYTRITDFYNKLPKLLEYKIFIDNIYRYKSHTLAVEEERVLSNITKAFHNDEETYTFLTDSDMSFGIINNDDNEEVSLTDTNYSIYIKSKKREVRKQAFKSLYKYYGQFQNTITSTLNGFVKQNVCLAHLRKYDSAFSASLFQDEMNDKVYNTLIKTVHSNLNVFYKYLRLKKEMLKLDEVHMYDIYASVVDDYDKSYSFEEGKKLVIEALKVLGDEYSNKLTKAFTDGWIDIYPNMNKKGGAYSSGSYDTMPYVLLNYQDQLNDVSTLAHELGHSIHSIFTRENNPYQYGNYPIFIAEVASTVNELLLAKYMLKTSKDSKLKLMVLNELLDLFKGTIYRQTMFAEFEKYVYDIIEKDEVMTSSKLCAKYYELNKEYFGTEVIVDDEIRYEWERVPHFYYDFYVYKYATGLTAAAAIVTKILNGEDKALDNYLKMLKSGSLKSPLETLKIAGVNMLDCQVYESAIKMFDELIEEFYSIIKQKK